MASNSDNQRIQSYIIEHYDIEVFASQGSGKSRSALGRLRNILITALNDNAKFPKYIIFVIEDDLIRCISYNKSTIDEIFSEILTWLTGKIHEKVIERKNALPLHAKRYLYPQIFWAELPYHTSLNNTVRAKFNQCLEGAVAQFNEMKILRIHRKWKFDDLSLVSSSTFSEKGKETYWAGIDKAIQFWENGRKRPVNKIGSGHEFVQNLRLEHTARAQHSLKRAAVQQRENDRYYWKKQKKLPKPPQKKEE